MKKTALFLGLMLACSMGMAGERNVKLGTSEPWSNVFGGAVHKFHYSVVAPQSFDGKLQWELNVSGRTIARGERQVNASPSQPALVEMELAIPPVKDGVVMQGQLVVSLLAEGGNKPAAVNEKTLWVFGEDPFVGRKEWLKKQNIQLFDPEKKTAEQLTKAGVPFTSVGNVDVLAEGEGLIVIGEGVSLRDYRGLSGVMLDAANKGKTVLCLSLSGGEMLLPGMGDTELPMPEKMMFARSDVIGRLDKRLDAEGWAPDGKISLSSMKLVGERGPVTAQVADGGSGWSWVDMTFAKGGRVVICGFGIIDKWNAGPTARYLFASILEDLSKKSGNLKRRMKEE